MFTGKQVVKQVRRSARHGVSDVIYAGVMLHAAMPN